MSIADRIASMSNNLSSAYGRIEYLGVDLSEVDKNMQNLSTVLDTIYNDYPKVSDEGTSPSIEGSRVGRLKSTLKASDTTQFTTTGKNLFNVNDINVKKNSVTLVITGSELKQTNTGTYCRSAWKIDNLTIGQDYILSYSFSNADSCSIQARLLDSTNNTTLQQNNTTTNTSGNSSLSFTATETTHYIRLYSNTLVTSNTSTVTYNNIQLEQGSTATDYEPYSGGIPSPSPNFPQNIHVVKGNNTVEVCGKNLFDGVVENGTYNPTNGSKTTGSNYRSANYISVKPNTIYKFSINGEGKAVNILAYKEDKTYIGIIGGSAIAANSSFTTPNETKYITMFRGTGDGNEKWQIEKGSEATTYEPYTGTAYPINLGDIELCKINAYQDKLFKAVSGDVIYDSLTSEQKAGLVSGGWYKYADFGKLVLNGSETSNDIGVWRKSTNTEMDRFILDLQPAWRIYKDEYATSLCNYFRSGNNAIGKWRNNVGSQLVFNFSEYGTTTLEQWKTWLSTHNLQLYQRLTTPTITQITDTTLISQLEALYSAMSKNGQTNILQTNADVPFTIFASALKGE